MWRAERVNSKYDRNNTKRAKIRGFKECKKGQSEGKMRAERWQGHHYKKYARMTKRRHKEDKYVFMKRRHNVSLFFLFV